MRSKLIAFLIAIVLGICSSIFFAFCPVIGRGSFLQFIIVCGFGFWIIVPAALIAVVAFLLSFKWLRNVFRWISTAALAVILIVIITSFSYIPGLIVGVHDIKKAKQYCEKLVPRLDSYKQQTGRYPETIDELLPKDRSLPILLREGDFYYGNSDTFYFNFIDPQGMMDGYEYDSNERKWYEWD